MTGEALLIGIAQIAVVIAGFAGLTAAFRRDERRAAIDAVRLRALVGASLTVTFLSLLPLVVFAALGNERQSFVAASALATVVVVTRGVRTIRQAIRRKGALAPERSAYVIVTSGILAMALQASNALVFASLAVYAAALLATLLVAALNFVVLLGEIPD